MLCLNSDHPSRQRVQTSDIDASVRAPGEEWPGGGGVAGSKGVASSVAAETPGSEDRTV